MKMTKHAAGLYTATDHEGRNWTIERREESAAYGGKLMWFATCDSDSGRYLDPVKTLREVRIALNAPEAFVGIASEDGPDTKLRCVCCGKVAVARLTFPTDATCAKIGDGYCATCMTASAADFELIEHTDRGPVEETKTDAIPEALERAAQGDDVSAAEILKDVPEDQLLDTADFLRSLASREVAAEPNRAAEYAAKVAERERENAEHALKETIREATRHLDALLDGRVSPSVGGSHLNRQVFEDAERALVSWNLAATIAAI